MQGQNRQSRGKRHTSPRGRPLRVVSETLCPADVLLIVPPFAALDRPSFGVHLLQAYGRQFGFRVQILYANLLLARMIGEKAYEMICNSPPGSFAGERFFARCAYGMPRLGRHCNKMFEWVWVVPDPDEGPEIEPDFAPERPISLQRLRHLEAKAEGFIESLATAITAVAYKIVGCTTSFEQTSASVAFLNHIKSRNKRTITMLGGANCESDMARGVLSLSASIDYIFSGDSEATFVEAIRTILSGSRPQGRIIHGIPCANLDALPAPSFTDFYGQRRRFLPHGATREQETDILYETSRGCWWGEKHHCTYCGVTGPAIMFRQKTPDRVIADLRTLLHAYPTRNIVMTDNIMPYDYFKTLLPRLTIEVPPHSIFYEEKANLSLAKILALKDAGVTCIQPGIEALSSRLLRLARKGVQARQNLMLLRYARAAGMQLRWDLLWGFPGDEIEAYQETLAIVPLLHHLPPPDGLLHLIIERFSPYFSSPAEFGLRKVTPISAYYDFLPKKADVRRIAYYFTADYRSGSHARLDVIRLLWRELERWHAAWEDGNGQPVEDLRIFQDGGSYVLTDTRRVAGTTQTYLFDRTQTSLMLTSRPYSARHFEEWAVQQQLAVVVDGWFVPLPVADPKILGLMEAIQGEARGENGSRRLMTASAGGQGPN